MNTLGSQAVLYSDDYEEVSYFDVAPNDAIHVDAHSGIEVLVMSGTINESNDTLEQHSWLRLPKDTNLHAVAGNEGAKLWVKRNHLNDVQKQVARVQAAAKSKQ